MVKPEPATVKVPEVPFIVTEAIVIEVEPELRAEYANPTIWIIMPAVKLAASPADIPVNEYVMRFPPETTAW